MASSEAFAQMSNFVVPDLCLQFPQAWLSEYLKENVQFIHFKLENVQLGSKLVKK